MLASVFRTVIVYVAVITAMRLMGKRQLGELQPAELVTTFLISNVASICIDEPDLPLAASIVPIFLLTALEILNSTRPGSDPRYARRCSASRSPSLCGVKFGNRHCRSCASRRPT